MIDHRPGFGLRVAAERHSAASRPSAEGPAERHAEAKAQLGDHPAAN
jgi:hypothetical protein